MTLKNQRIFLAKGNEAKELTLSRCKATAGPSLERVPRLPMHLLIFLNGCQAPDQLYLLLNSFLHSQLRNSSLLNFLGRIGLVSLKSELANTHSVLAVPPSLLPLQVMKRWSRKAHLHPDMTNTDIRICIYIAAHFSRPTNICKDLCAKCQRLGLWTWHPSINMKAC